MRLLFVADGRSPIALSWMANFVEAGHEVHLASTFPAEPVLKYASFQVIPVAFSGLKRAVAGSAGSTAALVLSGQKTGIWSGSAVGFRTAARQWLGLLTLPAAATKLKRLEQRIRPDLVHALRIPYEGMLAGRAGLEAPLVISVWGNDFTLHARANPWMAAATRRTLRRTSALHTDTNRDLRLAAADWGFDPARPGVVLPGGGGIRLERFYPPPEPNPAPVVINPRGIRAYVCSEAFFRALPLVLEKIPAARFLCPGMAGEPQAESWIGGAGVAGAVELLPTLDPDTLAGCYRRAQVLVSPTTHDGTPNTLLEGMACGCFPVCGDLESIREWITPGENGLLVDPTRPESIAGAIVTALQDEPLRRRAAARNQEIITRRAEYRAVMASAAAFYDEAIGLKP
jgi:hypothetical protein